MVVDALLYTRPPIAVKCVTRIISRLPPARTGCTVSKTPNYASGGSYAV